MKNNQNELPNVVPLYDTVTDENVQFYRNTIRNTLKRILPPNFLLPAPQDPDLLEDQQEAFYASLPLFVHTPCDTAPGTKSFYLISKSRPNAFKFFFDLVSSWLVPGKRLNTLLFYAMDFVLPDLGEEILTLYDITLRVENKDELEMLNRNLPIIESEVRLGMQSIYHARRILEIKGMTADIKTATIQEYIAFLINRLPKYFDHNLLTEMQHVLVICSDEFKADRKCRHLSRIISVHYLFRSALREAVRAAPEKRHLNLKLFNVNLKQGSGSKKVLGVIVGVNFLTDKEVFEERHLLSAIQNYIPTAQAVENSFFSNKRGNETICTLYLELEKSTGEEFTGEEMRLLRRELPNDLKDRIEHLMHPVFMPTNEEETVRNILSLSNQIKYLHDLPQMIISFEKQTEQELIFSVILVQIRAPGSLAISEQFESVKTSLTYIHERSKTVGVLRKKYVKEATVCTIKIEKNPFLRRDHSIDLSRARQFVVSELTKVFGEVRDFNGGMISKQHELLCAVRDQLSGIKYNDLLLENFFYSLTPDVMRTVMDPQLLKRLFLLLLDSIKQGLFNGHGPTLTVEQDSHHVLAMIKSEDKNIKEQVSRMLERSDYHATQLATSFVLVYDIAYVGYLFLSDDSRKQQSFCDSLKAHLIYKL